MFDKITKVILRMLKIDRRIKEEMFLFIAYDLESRGYDAHDLAGKTIYGVTAMYEPEHYKALMAAVESNDSDKINKAIITAYSELYDRYQCSLFNTPLDIYYFDYHFNAGRHAVEGIQTGINNIIFIKQLKMNKLVVDGDLGPVTRKAIKKITKKYETDLYVELLHHRHQFYLNNPQHRYIHGWCNRCDKIEYLTNRFIFK